MERDWKLPFEWIEGTDCGRRSGAGGEAQRKREERALLEQQPAEQPPRKNSFLAAEHKPTEEAPVQGGGAKKPAWNMLNLEPRGAPPTSHEYQCFHHILTVSATSILAMSRRRRTFLSSGGEELGNEAKLEAQTTIENGNNNAVSKVQS